MRIVEVVHRIVSRGFIAGRYAATVSVRQVMVRIV
jgi:hypothetical protein